MSKMLDEIRQQPAALEKTLARERRAAVGLRKVLEKRRPRMIILAARGTSDNAAQFARYLLEIETGIPVSLAAPSIHTLYGATVAMDDTMVVAISQSGESTDTNYVLERAKKSGAITVGITNEAGSTLAKLAEHVFLVRAGKEKSVAATKTYTGQLMSVYLLAHAFGARVPLDCLERLPEWAAQALEFEPTVGELAQRYRFMNRAVVAGRGLNYSNAFEMALKLMETCYIVAERFSSADLLHGPIAMVEGAVPVFVFAPPGITWSPMQGLLGKIGSLGAETFLITDQRNQAAVKMVEKTGRGIVLPLALPSGGRHLEDLYTPIPYIIPAQLLAAKLAVERGLNPDQPRALSKVTRTL